VPTIKLKEVAFNSIIRNNKNMRKGFAPIFFLILIAVVLLLVVGVTIVFFTFSNTN